MIGFIFLAIIHILLLVASFWIWFVIIKLFTDKEYRKYPPYVPSFGNEKKVIIAKTREILQNSDKPLTILDPGCGTGGLIFRLSKEFPQHKFIGIEWNKFAAGICKLKTKNRKNVVIFCDDMFNYDFGQADVIVCFLIEPLMERFGKKVLQDNTGPQIILSNTFEIPNIKLFQKFETGKGIFFKNVYMYKIG